MFINQRAAEFARRHAATWPWLTESQYEITFQRAVQHQYAKHCCTEGKLALSDVSALPHDNILRDAAVGVDDALSARKPGGKHRSDDKNGAGARGKKQKLSQSTQPQPWSSLTEAKQIVLGMQEDADNRLRKDVCIRWFLGKCEMTDGHGEGSDALKHSCLVTACEGEHNGSQAPGCMAVVQSIKQLGKY